MSSTADGQVDGATESEATAAHEETRSTQGDDAPDTTSEQQAAAHDTDETHRPVCRLLTLPPEIRAMILRFAFPDIKLPGPMPTGMTSLMLTLGDPEWRAAVVADVWQHCPIEWNASLSTKRWRRFKKSAVPGIRRLTITFELTDRTWFDLDSDIRQTLAWMWQRSKRGNQARYPWCLKQLHLRGVIYTNSAPLDDGDGHWYFARTHPRPNSMHWSQDSALEKLRAHGIGVSVDVKRIGPYRQGDEKYSYVY